MLILLLLLKSLDVVLYPAVLAVTPYYFVELHATELVRYIPSLDILDYLATAVDAVPNHLRFSRFPWRAGCEKPLNHLPPPATCWITHDCPPP
jgi:hypothetical protein